MIFVRFFDVQRFSSYGLFALPLESVVWMRWLLCNGFYQANGYHFLVDRLGVRFGSFWSWLGSSFSKQWGRNGATSGMTSLLSCPKADHEKSISVQFRPLLWRKTVFVKYLFLLIKKTIWLFALSPQIKTIQYSLSWKVIKQQLAPLSQIVQLFNT